MGSIQLCETTGKGKAIVKDLMEMYQMDEERWRQENIRLLQEGRLNEIDATNIAMCLAEMGKSDEREFKRYLHLILRHMLLLDHSGEERTFRHWRVELRAFRNELRDFTTKNWLNKYFTHIGKAFNYALQDAKDECPQGRYPEENPYTLIDVYGFDPTE